MDRRFNTIKISDDTGIYFFKYPSKSFCDMTLTCFTVYDTIKTRNTKTIKYVTWYPTIDIK